MSGPRQPGENPPLRLAGYGLLVIAAVAAIIGLVSLAGGGSEASPDPSVAQPGPSPEALPPDPAAAPPAEPAPAAPAEPAPAAPAEPAPAAPGEPAPAAPPAAAPPAAPPAGPTTPIAPPSAALPGAGLPSDDSTRSSGGKTGSSASAARAPVRVYNNSLITGLADRAADDMRGSGWQVTEVGNYPSANIPTSTVYYRPGTDEQAAARSLANSFGLRSLPRFEGIANAHPGLIVIVTKDYQRR